MSHRSLLAQSDLVAGPSRRAQGRPSYAGDTRSGELWSGAGFGHSDRRKHDPCELVKILSTSRSLFIGTLECLDNPQQLYARKPPPFRRSHAFSPGGATPRSRITSFTGRRGATKFQTS